MARNIVQAQGITKTFGEKRVLDGINLNVPQGSVLALLGPNGAGKTTTIRILTTLLKPDRGTATVAGLDVLRDPDKVRSSIGVANQADTVDVLLSGLQNLTMIGRLCRFSHKDARRRARDLIEQFALADAADRPVKEYSGGMRRRLDLAASLFAAPPILFLDEPTTSLDPESMIAIWELILSLVREGISILLTTQNLDEADHLADMVTVIDHGRILTSDTPARLKNRLGGKELHIALANPANLSKIPALQARAFSIETQKGELGFALPSGEEGLKAAASTLQQLIALDLSVRDYAIKQPTLEEAFLQLVSNQADNAGFRERTW